MNEFTIKIDLNDFFNDERRMAVLLVNRNWETVCDLQHRVESLFELRNIHFTTTDSCYVHPQESIRVVATADTLKAFVLSTDKHNAEDYSKKLQKRKFEQALSSSTPIPEAKRSKSIHKCMSPKLKGNNVVKDSSNISKCESTTINKTKSQNKSKSLINVSGEKDKSPSSGCDKSTRIVPLNGDNSHILLNNDEVDKTVEQNENEESNDTKSNGSISLASYPISKIIFRNALDSLVTKKARTFQLKPKKSNVKILEHITLRPQSVGKSLSNQMSEMTYETDTQRSILKQPTKEISPEKQTLNDSSVIILDESNESVGSKNYSANVTNIKKAKLSLVRNIVSEEVIPNYSTNADKLVETASPLENLPKPGDTIIFKVSLPSKKKKTVATTDFIEAICDYVNRRSKSVTLSLLSCSPNAEPYLRTYGANLDESNNSNLEKIILKFSQMIDPHIVKK